MINANAELVRLLDYSADAFCVFDKELTVLKVNRTFSTFFRMTKNDLEGRRSYEVLPERFCNSMRSVLTRILSGEERVEYEVKKQRSDGSCVFCILTAIPIRSIEGEITGIVENFRDITLLKQIEEDLHRSEQRYRLYFENVGDVLYTTNREFRITSVSPSVEAAIGYRPEEIVGRKIGDLNLLAHKYHEQALTNTARVLAGEYVSPSEYEFIAKDGTRKFAEVRGTPIREGGEIVGVANVARDITERKQAEEELKTYRDHLERLVETRTSELIAANRQLQEEIAVRKQVEEKLSREAEVNSALAELSSALVQAAPIEDISSPVLQCAEKLTRSVSGFIGYIEPSTGHFISSSRTKTPWEVCQVKEEDILFENSSIHTGFSEWVLEERKPLLTNSAAEDPRLKGVPEAHVTVHRFLAVPALMGKMLVGMVAVANSGRDYDERDQRVLERMAELYAIAIQHRQAEEALRTSETRYRHLSESLEDMVRKKVAELEQAESMAAIGQTISVVAHEIRNPLTNITLGLDSLRNRVGEDKENVEILEEVYYGVKILNRTFGELLDYSKPIALKHSSWTVNALVKEALRRIPVMPPNISTHAALDRGDEGISVDGEKMVRVLVNLISNAIDAMPGGGTLKISSNYCESPAGKTLMLFVSDTGCGISEELLAKVPEPFFTTKTRGTGLGVSICKQILKAHGGSLNIRSTVNEGTTVEIVLPILNS